MNNLRKSQKQLLNKIQDDSLFHLHRSFPFVLSFPPSFSLTNIHAIDSILFHSYWFSVIFFYNITFNLYVPFNLRCKFLLIIWWATNLLRLFIAIIWAWYCWNITKIITTINNITTVFKLLLLAICDGATAAAIHRTVFVV